MTVRGVPRLTRADFERVMRRGARRDADAVRMYWQREPEKNNRFGLTIKNGTLKRAVDRNKWKRLVRETVRKSGFTHGKGLSVVFFLSRQPKIELSMAQWEPVILELLRATDAR